MRTITRKQIMAAVEVSKNTLSKNYKAWGLHKCESGVLKGRKKLLFKEKVNETLLRLRVIDTPIP